MSAYSGANPTDICHVIGKKDRSVYPYPKYFADRSASRWPHYRYGLPDASLVIARMPQTGRNRSYVILYHRPDLSTTRNTNA